ncbi:hypothetical protein CEXT_118061 [Caerostris extrusa]|uniref:Uncharacterized protein n=1 Tax=Caerostris extrusa TaxID=172846 RepID=A0AAV4NDL9_CAEEX|nr:hypothetical protein CEXT_118061 [Caerostris extrusa]
MQLISMPEELALSEEQNKQPVQLISLNNSPDPLRVGEIEALSKPSNNLNRPDMLSQNFHSIIPHRELNSPVLKHRRWDLNREEGTPRKSNYRFSSRKFPICG